MTAPPQTPPPEQVSPYMTTAELAAHLRTTEDAVRQMRHRGTGPRGWRRGRDVLYPRDSVREWEAAKAEADEIGQRTDT